jgi:hypothetical protein
MSSLLFYINSFLPELLRLLFYNLSSLLMLGFAENGTVGVKVIEEAFVSNQTNKIIAVLCLIPACIRL